MLKLRLSLHHVGNCATAATIFLAHSQPYSERHRPLLITFLSSFASDILPSSIPVGSLGSTVCNMLRTRLLHAQASPAMKAIQMNPYKAQKAWPPDFSKISPKHQFRLERKYRRRSKLKFARPRWIRGVKLAQWGISLSMRRRYLHDVLNTEYQSIGIGAYCIFWLDWGPMGSPFSGVRACKIPAISYDRQTNNHEATRVVQQAIGLNMDCEHVSSRRICI